MYSRKGIDIGAAVFGEKTKSGRFETFTENSDRINAMFSNIRSVTLKGTAEMLSFTEKDGKKIDFINCTGELNGSIITLCDIPAYGFCGFSLKK